MASIGPPKTTQTCLATELTLALLASGCETPFLPLPPLPEAARSAILVSFAEGSPTFLALDLDTQPALQTRADELSLATYSLTLEELSLEPGPFTPPSPAPCAWTRPLAVYVAAPDRSFQETTPDAFLQALVPDAYPRCDRCPDFAEEIVPYGPTLPGGISIDFVATQGDGIIVATNALGTFFVTEFSVSTLNGCDSYEFAGRLDDSHLWAAPDLLRSLDLVEVTPPDCRVVQSMTSSLALDLGALLVADNKVYLGTRSGTLLAFQDDTLTKLGQVEGDPANPEIMLASFGPGQIAFSAGGKDALVMNGGAPRTYQVSESSAVRALGMFPGVGLVAADAEGALYTFAENGFTPLRRLARTPVGAILPYGSGAIVTNDASVIFFPSRDEACEPHPIAGSSNQAPAKVLVKGDRIFIADTLEDLTPSALWLIPK
ncbi:MAG: hypothetical protein HY791_35240 [Deltaproteobacteria bacterium]|nr:hypothetical protein [Deltaproteobacteria bacterium]